MVILSNRSDTRRVGSGTRVYTEKNTTHRNRSKRNQTKDRSGRGQIFVEIPNHLLTVPRKKFLFKGLRRKI